MAQSGPDKNQKTEKDTPRPRICDVSHAMKISKLTAAFGLSVVTALVMGLLSAVGGGIAVFLLMLALILMTGARVALSVHDDSTRESHTSLTHIVLDTPKTQTPAPKSDTTDAP